MRFLNCGRKFADIKILPAKCCILFEQISHYDIRE